MKKIKKILQALFKEILETRLDKLPKKKSFLFRHARMIILAVKGFDEDKCQLHASALTFYSLLSIVPVLAMIFGIAKGFGFEDRLETQLMEKFSDYEAIVQQVMGFVHSMIANTQGGLIAGVGLAVLLWSVINVLSSIETSFNDIWKVKKSRAFMRKFSDYLSIMLIAPVLILVSSSLTVFVTSSLARLTQENSLFEFLGPFVQFSMKVVPYILIWILLTFVYLMLPNTKVKFKSALIAAIIAGTIYQLLQWGYIYFQISISHYNTIYGSFAALPLLLFWLRLSWLIVLFGAEISFAHQNINRYEQESSSLKISPHYKRLISLRIANLIFKNFETGKTPYTSNEISNILEIPIGLVRAILFELTSVKILIATITDVEKENAYQPVKDIHSVYITDVIYSLDYYGINELSIPKTNEFNKIKMNLDKFNDIVSKSSDNILLKDI
ncbi:MAG: ribonuclease BN [Bacteroidetes bacterium GWF2_33_38]|nr:MAG: ribonuclease BN [Bacteroidetes bacterium GWF2_33_38]OFY68391.1 MAG: ribonuclease BN [Bacteroidetes bacterium RIFOXYA12_FULL_33_9]HBX51498.1 YihY/virulence factor BrkB family protein [Bacteroidales bacterium]